MAPAERAEPVGGHFDIGTDMCLELLDLLDGSFEGAFGQRLDIASVRDDRLQIQLAPCTPSRWKALMVNRALPERLSVNR